jgi:archaellum component FlaC
MESEIKKLQKQVSDLKKEVMTLSQYVNSLKDTTYKTNRREIINREVQFMQAVYNKAGTKVIN